MMEDDDRTAATTTGKKARQVAKHAKARAKRRTYERQYALTGEGLTGKMLDKKEAYLARSAEKEWQNHVRASDTPITDSPASHSSRIFISGLPPNLSQSDFRKHFSQSSVVTDAKLLPDRRIGFVGYASHEEAQKAVKYFNKSFIRMSRLRVELAKPIAESKAAPKLETSGNGASAEKAAVKTDGELEKNEKLEEYLEISRAKKRKRNGEQIGEAQGADDAGRIAAVPAEKESDDEYEEVQRKKRRQSPVVEPSDNDNEETDAGREADKAPLGDQTGVSDADWARSRTSRLLGLLDDNEEDDAITPHPEKDEQIEPVISMPTPPSDEPDINNNEQPMQTVVDTDLEKLRSTKRLFIRNLPYGVQAENLESDLKTLLEPYGDIEDAHVVRDKKSGDTKGTAYVQFEDPDAATTAFQREDGQTFHGRIIHILPADAKRDTKLDDFALSKLPHKKQQEILKRREVASQRFNWNSLYMNQDAVVSSIASRFGLAKSEVLDPTSSNAAVKQAQAETQILQETKNFFKQQGIDLEAFKRKGAGDSTVLLVKNIPYGCDEELRKHFEQYGDLKRLLVPPTGTIAIVEFFNVATCDAAYGGSKNRRFKSSVLYLERAPSDLFASAKASSSGEARSGATPKASAKDLKDSEDASAIPDNAGRVTLHVKNLSFKTTTQTLEETFKPLSGFLSAVVQPKKDPKRPNELLSAGYGFLEFRTSQQAQATIKTMNGYKLDGHEIEIKVSRKTTDAAEERRRLDAEKRGAGKKTKIAIKNLPFETSKKDIRQLFGAYGQLRSVRAPRKMDGSLRGYGFAEFTTPKEAESAMDALRDTHLLGRKLVLDFADEEPEDAETEIAKMQERVGSQVNKVALQKLTGAGRRKFTTQAEEE